MIFKPLFGEDWRVEAHDDIPTQTRDEILEFHSRLWQVPVVACLNGRIIAICDLDWLSEGDVHPVLDLEDDIS